MENSFNNRDFEKFVKQNADQYRMFPTEKVWKGIHSALHSRRRWYGIGLALLLLTTAAVTGVMLMPGNKSGRMASLSNTVTAKTPAVQQQEEAQVAILAPRDKDRQNIFPGKLREQLSIAPGNAPANGNLANAGEDKEYQLISLPSHQSMISPATVRDSKQAGPDKKAVGITVIDPPLVRIDVPVFSLDKQIAPPPAEDEKKTKNSTLFPPFTIESVVNSYTHLSTRKKLEWQLYFTPTISYRNLSENTEFISATRYNSIVNGGGQVNPVYYSTDVNSVVNHKPDLGFQLGARAAYPVSKWVSITGGFQFGVSKYDIKAYDHSAEMTTIALTAGNGSTSVSAVSNYRNGTGYKANWLRNFYFSASLPVGLELKLSDGNKNYFGIGGTLQPTYVLDNRAYLISTDYKNYAEVPSLTRRFNMNTTFEIFTAHTTGKLKWRIGPQVHYQIMSSFIRDYPIKEHLFDFGLKLGVTLN